MTPRLTLHASAAHDVVHTSRVFAGFDSLARRGLARVRWAMPTGGDAWLGADPIVVCFDLEEPVRARVAIDLRDGEGTSWPIVDRVDWYFKRAWYRPEVETMPAERARRVRPFGLNYGARTATSVLRFLGAVGRPLVADGPRGWRRIRQLLAVPDARRFEQGPDVPVDRCVMFQTRLWTADEIVPAEVEPLNAERVAMVRALRQAFGPRFIGGLVPTALAVERYPDEVTPHPSRYADYLALKKRCLVNVYTRGVEHSLAFKLGETFAASLCLVSVPLRYELPRPLEPGRHFLPFDSPQGCIVACQRLLDDARLARDLRHAAHEYYRLEVEPASQLARLIATVSGEHEEASGRG